MLLRPLVDARGRGASAGTTIPADLAAGLDELRERVAELEGAGTDCRSSRSASISPSGCWRSGRSRRRCRCTGPGMSGAPGSRVLGRRDRRSGLTGAALFFLFGVMEESRNINNPTPIFAGIAAAAIFFALLRGPVGKAIGKMLEGNARCPTTS